MTSNYVHSEIGATRDVGVIWDGKRADVAIQSHTGAEIVASYDGRSDGISLAIAYARHLAHGPYSSVEQRREQIALIDRRAQEIFAMGPRNAFNHWLEGNA